MSLPRAGAETTNVQSLCLCAELLHSEGVRVVDIQKREMMGLERGPAHSLNSTTGMCAEFDGRKNCLLPKAKKSRQI